VGEEYPQLVRQAQTGAPAFPPGSWGRDRPLGPKVRSADPNTRTGTQGCSLGAAVCHKSVHGKKLHKKLSFKQEVEGA